MVHGLFSFPHTKRYENDVLLCAGNDANRTAEKFLHNSIQFLLNPNGKPLPKGGRNDRDKKGGLGNEREEEGLKIECNNGGVGRQQSDLLKGKRKRQQDAICFSGDSF